MMLSQMRAAASKEHDLVISSPQLLQLWGKGLVENGFLAISAWFISI